MNGCYHLQYKRQLHESSSSIIYTNRETISVSALAIMQVVMPICGVITLRST